MGTDGPINKRLQQVWRVRIFKGGAVHKQYEEWRDVPCDTAPVSSR